MSGVDSVDKMSTNIVFRTVRDGGKDCDHSIAWYDEARDECMMVFWRKIMDHVGRMMVTDGRCAAWL